VREQDWENRAVERIGSLESILGLLQSLKIRALGLKREGGNLRTYMIREIRKCRTLGKNCMQMFCYSEGKI
jgi:hypothetical protein